MALEPEKQTRIALDCPLPASTSVRERVVGYNIMGVLAGLSVVLAVASLGVSFDNPSPMPSVESSSPKPSAHTDPPEFSAAAPPSVDDTAREHGQALHIPCSDSDAFGCSQIGAAQSRAAHRSRRIRVGESRANCRSGPNLRYAIRETLNPGDPLYLLEAEAGWIHVEIALGQCWIARELVTGLDERTRGVRQVRSRR
ncbi:MAG TPA: hypothetical protein VF603_01210 [Allosphingosinicella sp.]|jgi:hypothetical protein